VHHTVRGFVNHSMMLTHRSGVLVIIQPQGPRDTGVMNHPTAGLRVPWPLVTELKEVVG